MLFRRTQALFAARPLPAAGALFLLLAVAYSFSIGLRATRGASITGDEPFYLLTTQSLLQDGDLDLRQQYERRSYVSFFDHPDGLWRQSVPRPDGSLLSPHEPGLSVLLLPGFVLAGLTGAQVQLMLLAALTFALAFVLTARLTQAPLAAWLACATVGLSATAFVYSTEVYPETPAALCLVAALLLLSRERPGWRTAVGMAMLLSALAWLGMKYVPLGAVVGVVFLLGASPRGRVCFLGLSLLSGAAYAWLHLALFGDLTAYSLNTVHEGDPASSVVRDHLALEDRLYRVWGLFIDRRFGLGRWAPLLLLVPPALPLLLARGRLARTMAALIVVQVLVASFVAITMMGWWFPGRNLVVVLPLFPAVLTLLALKLVPRWRLALACLALWSLAITAALVVAARASEVTLAVDPFDLRAPVFAAVAPLFPDYRAWPWQTVALTVAWLAAAVALAASLCRPSRRLPNAWTRRRNPRDALGRLSSATE